MIPYHLHLLRCKDGSFYTGYSQNVKRRFEAHKRGKGAKSTRFHKPARIVYVEEFRRRGEAMHKERKIKMLNHTKKQLLTDFERRR